jgi:protein-S-isoprenylcysteine O-methyltransferase Ste14
VDALVDEVVEHLTTNPPAILRTSLLWPVLAVLLLAGVLTDLRVNWDEERRYGVDWGDVLLVVGLFAAGVASMVTGATFPAGDSLLWPLAGFTIMATATALRWWATGVLGADFNAALRTRPGQVVRSEGPFRWVRHPGYLGAYAYQVGAILLFGWWPPVLVLIVTLGLGFRRRIKREEAINRQAIVGYEEYMRQVRWRMIPGLW